MDEEACRKQFEGRLGIDLPSPVWRNLKEEGYVNEVISGRDTNMQKLARAAAKLLRGGYGAKSEPPDRWRIESEGTIELDEADKAYAFAQQDYFAPHAAANPLVRGWRRNTIGDALLTTKEALAFLRSPAIRVLTRKHFLAWSISPVRHTAEVVEQGYGQGTDSFDRSVTLRIDGEIFVLRCGSAITTDGYREGPGCEPPTFCLRPPDGALIWKNEKEGRAWTSRGLCAPTERTLAVPAEVSKSGEIEVWCGSLADELRIYSEALAEEYHWLEAAATWFVLTGEAPLVLPLTAKSVISRAEEVGDFDDVTITLRASVWVSWRKVLALFRQIQREFLHGDTGKREYRALDVFRFVTREVGILIADNDKRWSSLLEQWRSEHPTEAKPFKAAWQFRQSYKRARQTLLWRKCARAHDTHVDFDTMYKKALGAAEIEEEREGIQRMVRGLGLSVSENEPRKQQ